MTNCFDLFVDLNYMLAFNALQDFYFINQTLDQPSAHVRAAEPLAGVGFAVFKVKAFENCGKCSMTDFFLD